MKPLGNQVTKHIQSSRKNSEKITLTGEIFDTLLAHSNSPDKQDELNASIQPAFSHIQHFCLSELLPYDMNTKTGAGLKNALKDYDMLLNAALEAMKALEQGEITKFDALVGENACQIRTVWIAIIISNNLIHTQAILNELYNTRKRIRVFLEEKQISLLMRDGISLQQLVEREKISSFLSLEEFVLINSFLLTEAKEVVLTQDGIISLCHRERSNPKKLKRFGDISSQFANDLLSRSRRLLAENSVQFVRNIAASLGDEKLINMLSEQYSILHNNHLLCTPMFWTYKTILSALKHAEIPLIIHANFIEPEADGYRIFDSASLFFKPIFKNDGSLQLMLTSPMKKDFNEVACVVEGIVLSDKKIPSYKSKWNTDVLRFPISTVILAGAADHRQYPCAESNEKIALLQDNEYEFHRSFARAHGFSIDNPRTFFIRHVYPSYVRTFYKEKKEKIALPVS